MDAGLVSIVMPSYNTARFLSETVASVLAQTYTDWELLIVDDCSTDGSVDYLSALSDPRIRLLQNETNSGAAVSRTRALREAKGRWIAFLDSDDLWTPDKLEKQIGFMQENGCAFSYTFYSEIDEDSRPLGRRVTGPKRITYRGEKRYCWQGCLTVMYDRQKIGLIQAPDIKKNNDYAMWLEVARIADCRLLPLDLARYRIRTGSISRHSVFTMISWHYRLFREAEKTGRIASVFCTLRNLFFGTVKKAFYVKKDKPGKGAEKLP